MLSTTLPYIKYSNEYGNYTGAVKCMKCNMQCSYLSNKHGPSCVSPFHLQKRESENEIGTKSKSHQNQELAHRAWLHTTHRHEYLSTERV